MNLYRKLLRVWVAVSSVIGFVMGWVFIARATETETVTYVGDTTVNMPELAPMPTVEGLTGESLTINDVQTFTVTSSQQSFSPPMRTGGS